MSRLIFGTGLARSATSATSLPLPTRLDGTAVLIGDLQLEAGIRATRRSMTQKADAAIYTISTNMRNWLLYS
jgi:hypothetical protein